MYNDPDKRDRPAQPGGDGEWTKEEPGRAGRREGSFDFDAFLQTDNLEAQVTGALDGKRNAGTQPPRRNGERGRHEAPGPEPEDEDPVFPGEPPTQRFSNREAPEPPRQEPTWQPPQQQQPVRPAPPVNVPPPRPKVVVADPVTRRVVVTPETHYDDTKPEKKGMGKAMKFFIALLITVAVVLAVAAAAAVLLPGTGGDSQATPAPSPTDYLFGGLPTRPPTVPTAPPATPVPEPTAPPEDTPPAVTYYTITVTAGPGGSVSPNGMVDVAEGDSAVFSIYPDEGYTLAQLLVDGAGAELADTYTFTDVRQGHTLYAVFQQVQPIEPPVTDPPVIPDAPVETDVPVEPEPPSEPDVPPAVEG